MTAVEWLQEQLTYQYEGQTLNKFYDWKDITEIYNQAKEMEKQQMIDFATDFARDYIGFSSVCTDVNDLGPAAYYYNQVNK